MLTPNYKVVARFQGGPNAGHTLEFENQKYVLRSIPSGIFQGGKINLIGNGVVIDPALFKAEVESLEASGHTLTDRLYISKKAHLILPTHRLLDSADEAAKGNMKIGTTGKGIGPVYTDKTSRHGLRVGDIFHNFQEKYDQAVGRHKEMLDNSNFEYDLAELEEEWFAGLEKLKTFKIIDSEQFVNDQLKQEHSVLAEGAQGSLLDIDFGTYPFVTSSNTVCAGACTGLGIAPHTIGEVFGIFKAYLTRVGSGPFPTELFDADGDEMRKKGNEFGSVTGRPRRCGWIDLVALKYTIMINGVTQLIMMKSDVMDAFDTIKLCVAYDINGETTENFPFELNEGITPEYVEMFNAFLSFIEDELEVPIKIVSVGPDRAQTIIR